MDDSADLNPISYIAAIILVALAALLGYFELNWIALTSLLLALVPIHLQHNQSKFLNEKLNLQSTSKKTEDQSYHEADDALSSALQEILPVWKNQIESL